MFAWELPATPSSQKTFVCPYILQQLLGDSFCPAAPWRNLFVQLRAIHGGKVGQYFVGHLWGYIFGPTKESRGRKPSSAHCELKHWNFGGWKCLIHGLHFTVKPLSPSLIHCLCALFASNSRLCAFFRPLSTPVSRASWPTSQFTVCTSRYTRLWKKAHKFQKYNSEHF